MTDKRIKDLSPASSLLTDSFFPVENNSDLQTRKASGQNIIDLINANIVFPKSMSSFVVLAASTPKSITVSAGMDARYCQVTVRDPSNSYENVAMRFTSPDENTVILDVGLITPGNYLVLIVEA